jgi:uncharacterized protein YjbI with pentapeptide repeats
MKRTYQTMRKANIKAFTLGAIIYGALSAILILLYFNDPIPNLSYITYTSISIFVAFVALVTLLYIFKNIIIKKFLGIDLNKINYFNPKDLVFLYTAVTTRTTLLTFTFLLFASIVGLLNIVFIQKQNQIMQQQLKEQQSITYANMRENVFKHLFDSENNHAKYNTRIRENSLQSYILTERVKKHENFSSVILENKLITEYPHSPFKIDLSHALLQDIVYTNKNLDEMSLNFVNFNRADLSFTNFYFSSLSYADFEHAILVEANLTSTVLMYTNFYKAKMNNAQWGNNTHPKIFNCNIYKAEINSDFKKYLLDNGCVEEENLSKWKEERRNAFKKLRYGFGT